MATFAISRFNIENMKKLVLVICVALCSVMAYGDSPCPNSKCENGKIAQYCQYCEGRGEKYCSTCHGYAVVNCGFCFGNGHMNCSYCRGRGYTDYEGKVDCQHCENGIAQCENCRGSGKVPCPSSDCYDGIVKCRQCDASGIHYWKCPTCNGRGRV